MSAMPRSSRRFWPPESVLTRALAFSRSPTSGDHLVDVARRAVVAGEDRVRLAHREVRPHLRLLQDDADPLAEVPPRPLGIVAEDAHFAGIAFAVALEDLDGRRLAGAVGPEQPEDLSFLDREVDLPDRLEVAVGLAQAADLDRRHRRRRVDGTRRYSRRVATFRYVVADVFTDVPLAGNQLAVFTDAREIPEERLQPLARELNLAETVFVYPAAGDGHARIRIFTPTLELPFAGHPVLGTAFVLGGPLQLDELWLETGAGVVPVRLEREGSRIGLRLDAAAAVPLRAVRPRGGAARPARRGGVRAAGRALPPGAGPRPDRARLARGGCGAAARLRRVAGAQSLRHRLSSPATASAGRRASSSPPTGFPRIPRPARPQGRSRSISPGTAGSASATRSRSGRAWRSGGRRRSTPSPARRRRSRSAAPRSSSRAGSSGCDARSSSSARAAAARRRLCARLAELLRARHIEIDALYHDPNWESCGPRCCAARVSAATEARRLGRDGTYHTIIGDLVLERADTVVWLDLPVALVMWRLVRRTLAFARATTSCSGTEIASSAGSTRSAGSSGPRSGARSRTGAALPARVARASAPRRCTGCARTRTSSAFVQSIQATESMSGSSNGSDRQKTPPLAET